MEAVASTEGKEHGKEEDEADVHVAVVEDDRVADLHRRVHVPLDLRTGSKSIER